MRQLLEYLQDILNEVTYNEESKKISVSVVSSNFLCLSQCMLYQDVFMRRTDHKKYTCMCTILAGALGSQQYVDFQEKQCS